MNQYAELVGLWLGLCSGYQLATQNLDSNLILVFWNFWFAWISSPMFKKHLIFLTEIKKGMTIVEMTNSLNINPSGAGRRQKMPFSNHRNASL